jgi:integrase
LCARRRKALDEPESPLYRCPRIVYSWTNEPNYRMSVKEEQVEADVEIVDALAVSQSSALAEDVKHVREYLGRTKAESTLKAYEDDWRRFKAWAATRGVRTLPATSETVSAHLGWLASEGYSLSIITRFLSSAGHFHHAVGLDFPRNAIIVSETLKGIRRGRGMQQTKKAPLGLGALTTTCRRVLAEAAHRGEPDIGLRNRAMLTVGWFCMLRSANLVAIRREHVQFVPEGLTLYLPSSKTDQLKKGREVAVHTQGDKTVCPTVALTEYFEAIHFAPGDLIFPVSERTVTRLVKRLVADPEHGHKSLREIDQCVVCGETVRRFGSHSLRRGSATELAERGAERREIMRQGGWKSEPVMDGYIEHATLFQNNPTKDLTGAPPGPASVAVQVPPQKVQVRRRKRRRRRRRYAGRII